MKQTKQSPVGTSYHMHTISATVNQLKSVLGEPEYNPNDGRDKVNFEWEMETDNGDVFTVYDYKEYRTISEDEIIEWHIGGKSSSVTALAQSEIKNALSETNNNTTQEKTIREKALSKDEAIAAMLQGKKVTHQHFTDNEWMKLNGHFEVEFEDGCKIDVDTFWKDRKGEGWQTGWSIYTPHPQPQEESKEEGEKEKDLSEVSTEELQWRVDNPEAAKWYDAYKGSNQDFIKLAKGCIKQGQQLQAENTSLKEQVEKLREALQKINNIENGAFGLKAFDVVRLKNDIKEALQLK